MSYMFALGTCYGCKCLFSFNPELVPSIPINGVREPICRDCVERVNPLRQQKGLPPIVPLAGAYEPAECA